MSDNYKKLNALFDAVSIIAEGAYVYVCDMKTNMSRWSKSAVEYFGLPDEYMLHAGLIWAEHIHPDDKSNYDKNINDIFNGTSNNHNLLYRAKAADGSYCKCTCKGAVIHNEKGDPDYFCGIIRNHRTVSYVDAITGHRTLYGFLDDLKGILFSNRESILIMVGLSSFSNINDFYGYSFGDNTIQGFARKIYEFFPDDCKIYRMNGTRFAIITSLLSYKDAEEIYNKLNGYLRKEFFVDEQRVVLSLNGGAISVNNYDISAETYYSCLRAAYYHSKNKRCGGFVVFDDVDKSDNTDKIKRINVIRNSIAEGCNGFYLCYQPIIDSHTEKINGVEALIRWKNDEYGAIYPSEFIEVLEQDTLFPELGKWILRQAMEDGNRFREKNPDISVSVNLSYSQLEKNGFINDLFEIIDETGFPKSQLCLEITERCQLLNIDLLRNMFTIFRENGIKIAVDDFCTGFSTLGFLRSVPVDIVKIDREFVKNIKVDQADKSSVQFISDLAGAFSADVCAEGIENDEIRVCMKDYNNIGSLQGYHYSKPITADSLLELLDAINKSADTPFDWEKYFN